MLVYLIMSVSGVIVCAIQVDIDRSRKVLRISRFKEEHYQNELRIDLAEAFEE